MSLKEKELTPKESRDLNDNYKVFICDDNKPPVEILVNRLSTPEQLMEINGVGLVCDKIQFRSRKCQISNKKCPHAIIKES